jgi:hypothetical protein
MKIFLLLLLVLLALVKNTVAQTYTIPWAQQQPAWVFPLWFEDASGAKDTLYYAYDPFADQIPYYDTLLGEKEFIIDTSKFQAYYLCSFDSNLKINKCFVIGEQFLQFGIDFCFWKCQLPLIIRWDVNLFRSAALPFPDLSPAPRAQGQIVFDLPFFAPPFCAYDAVLLLTDSTYDGNYLGCVYKDSLIFENVFGNNGTSYIGFSIRPWTGLVIGVDYPTEIDDPIFVYPNPCEDWIYLKNNNSNESLRFKIRDINGLIIQTDILQNQKIDVRNINSGFYTIEFYNRANQKYYYNYFIKG